MAGVMFLYVGAVLLINGMAGLNRVEPRSMAILNFLVGLLGLTASLLQLIRAESTEDYFVVATFLLFTFTYLYVALSVWFETGMQGFGWFCFFVAITTLPCSLVNYQTGETTFAIFWIIWGGLWFMFYRQGAAGTDFGNILPFSTIGVGVFTCWIPGLLMLTGNW